MSTSGDLIHIDPRDVTFITRRTRDAAGFERVKESIRQIGLRTVLQVQDISSWPAEKRSKPVGGLYKWRAAFGQGRCGACIALYEETGDRRFLKVPARVVKSPESELAGMSMTENMLRKGYTWMEQAKLMKRDIENFPPEVVARGYSVTVPHLKKVLGILQKLNPKLEKQLKSMTIAEAEALVSLPQPTQEIVLEVMADEGTSSTSLPAIVRKAREVSDGGQLSKTALKAILKRVSTDLAAARDSVKLMRRDTALGTDNLLSLLTEKKYAHIKAAIDAARINYERFLEAAKTR